MSFELRDSMNAPTEAIWDCHVRAAITQLIEEDRHVAQVERRDESRFPYFQPLRITSEYFSGHRLGISRQISRFGIGLLHSCPLDESDVTVTMCDPSGYGVSLPLEKTWCRPCGAGWYVSGGRFLDLAANGDPVTSMQNQFAEVQTGHSGYRISASTPLLKQMLQSVRRIIDQTVEELEHDPKLDRRSEERYYATLPATATPIDDDSEPHGDSFEAVTRDISRRGISLFTRQAVDSRLLALELADRNGQNRLKAVMHVLRCRSVGHLYEIAGEFVAKMYLR